MTEQLSFSAQLSNRHDTDVMLLLHEYNCEADVSVNLQLGHEFVLESQLVLNFDRYT